MTTFDIFENAVGGTIPSVISQLPSLKLFDIEKNTFTGPAFIDLSGSTLESYRVSFNKLSGTVPDLTATPTLREVWAADNTLSGTIPASIGVLSDLGTCNCCASDLPKHMLNILLPLVYDL